MASNLHWLEFFKCTVNFALEWPKTLKGLEFTANSFYNHPVDNLPPTLTILILSNNFNQRLDDLPPNLKSLTTGDAFNLPLDNLPKSLLKLFLGNNFNQPIDSLPPHLAYLETGDNFNQKLEYLPNSLTFLDLSKSDFNQCIDNLPLSLRVLKIGEEFDRTVHKWPPSLVKVSAPISPKSERLPPNVSNLEILDYDFASELVLPLPYEIKKLTFNVNDYTIRLNLISMMLKITNKS